MQNLIRFFLLLLTLAAATQTLRAQCSVPPPSSAQFVYITPTSFTVTWTAVAGAPEYRVKAGTSPLISQATYDHITANIQATVPGTNGSTYHVWIASCGASAQDADFMYAGQVTLPIIITDDIVSAPPVPGPPYYETEVGHTLYGCLPEVPYSQVNNVSAEKKLGLFFQWNTQSNNPKQAYCGLVATTDNHIRLKNQGPNSSQVTFELVAGGDDGNKVFLYDYSVNPPVVKAVFFAVSTDEVYEVQFGLMVSDEGVEIAYTTEGENFSINNTEPCLPLGAGNARSNYQKRIPNTLTASPNPFTDQIDVRLRFTQASALRVALYDAFGRAVLVQERGLVQPDGSGELQFVLPAADLAPGVYRLVVETAEGRQTRALVKQ